MLIDRVDEVNEAPLKKELELELELGQGPMVDRNLMRSPTELQMV